MLLTDKNYKKLHVAVEYRDTIKREIHLASNDAANMIKAVKLIENVKVEEIE